MKLFKRGKITRIDGLLFPIFLIENTTSEFDFGYRFEHGWGNGYVGLPSWHPYYKMDYDNIPVSCHGGLTFGQLDEDENLWVIGFDTCHSGDNRIKWSKDAVQMECERIVEQCMDLKESQRIMKLKKLNKINKRRKC